MSSILKALKKLEQEKAARRSREPNITGAMLKTPVTRSRYSPWLIPAGMLLVAVAAVLTTYSFMGGFSRKSAPDVKSDVSGLSPAKQPAPASATPLAPAAILQPQPVPPSNLPSPQISIESSKPSIRANAATSQSPPAPKRLPASQQVRIPMPPSPTPAIAEPNDAPARPFPQTAPELPAEPHRPVLKVSGIAWQKDSASRLAMVNGTSVVEGSVVDGARVEEILPDKVRFSFENKTYEVGVGKSSDH